MEPSTSPRQSDADASSSDLTSLISETTFPWDLSDSEDDDSYAKEFAEEAVREKSVTLWKSWIFLFSLLLLTV
jgi:hypothetical protein